MIVRKNVDEKYMLFKDPNPKIDPISRNEIEIAVDLIDAGGFVVFCGDFSDEPNDSHFYDRFELNKIGEFFSTNSMKEYKIEMIRENFFVREK